MKKFEINSFLKSRTRFCWNFDFLFFIVEDLRNTPEFTNQIVIIMNLNATKKYITEDLSHLITKNTNTLI